ncbi:MAG: UDP-2,3-diacylglucosamine diphosphatase, partial [Bacteroidales bacterium]|nr:UDP-2,3-diacylglucosamine diphosphatase [Bacteroidales bacterium]
PVHMFRGNHDIWAFNYLTNELNIKLYRNPILREFDGKKFFLAHGDGLGPGDNGYKFLKKVFEFKPNQWLFRWLHPDIGSRMGLYFSQKSRLANITKSKNNVEKVDIDNEMLFHYAHETLSKQPDINYFVFGHRHIPIQKNIADNSELIILGDWLNIFSYGVFENGIMRLEYFEADH